MREEELKAPVEPPRLKAFVPLEAIAPGRDAPAFAPEFVPDERKFVEAAPDGALPRAPAKLRVPVFATPPEVLPRLANECQLPSAAFAERAPNVEEPEREEFAPLKLPERLPPYVDEPPPRFAPYVDVPPGRYAPPEDLP